MGSRDFCVTPAPGTQRLTWPHLRFSQEDPSVLPEQLEGWLPATKPLCVSDGAEAARGSNPGPEKPKPQTNPAGSPSGKPTAQAQLLGRLACTSFKKILL